MRKAVPVFFGLGGFLLFAGLVAMIFGPGIAERTPLSTNSHTDLSGTASVLNAATGQVADDKVVALSVNQVDSKASDGKVAAWTSYSCLVVDRDNPPKGECVADDRLVASSTDVFATDRHDALAVNSAKYLPSSAKPHSGVVNKFPFDAKKQAYPFWDGVVGKAVQARYAGTSTVSGVAVNVYRTHVKDAAVQVAKGIEGTYDDVTTLYVDPRTGAILNQTDDQQRFLADGTKALDLKLAFTPAQQRSNAADARTNKTLLTVVTIVIPVIGIVGGIVLLLLGIRAIRGTHRSSAGAHGKAAPLPA